VSEDAARGPGETPSTSAYWDAAMETTGRDALAELQLTRLRHQLDRCYKGSEFYRSRLRAAGFAPGDLSSLDNLRALPVVTKDELRAEQEEHRPFGRFVVAPEDSLRELHPSSGTTGFPVNTLWSAADVAAITDMTARTLWQFGVRPGDVIQNAFAYGLWIAGLSTHYACAKIRALVIPTGTGVPTQKQIQFLLHARATVLLSTPSYALHIAEELAREGVSTEALSLRRGCFGGEAGTENPSTRKTLEERLGIDAYDYYGLAEIGPTFASECLAKAGLHFAEDHILVECIDPVTRQPVGEGEIGVLVFTHLTREATPMLRYWSNDYARLTYTPCDCGRTHVRAAGGVLGRHDDLVVFKGAKFYPSQVEKVVRSFAELSPEFRIEVDRKPHGLVRVCTIIAEWLDRHEEGLETRLVDALRAELGVTPGVRIEPPGTLERTAFKAVRLVDVNRASSAGVVEVGS
jgi:phenylacetate-CoA ligase